MPMKILGHGVDLVDIDEFEKWLEDPRDPLGLRCFTPSELAIVGEGPNRAESLAGRFAAKEAVLKALGIGFGDGAALPTLKLQMMSTGLRRSSYAAALQQWRSNAASPNGL
jgi:phosphopantetheine--protein transferase-like protein